MTKPENFLKSSSELNLVLRSITRSQVLRCAGPAWITASISLHTEVFIRPNEVMTSSWNVHHGALLGILMSLWWPNLQYKSQQQTFHIFKVWLIRAHQHVSMSIMFCWNNVTISYQDSLPWDHPLGVCEGQDRAHGGGCSALQPCWSMQGWRCPGKAAAAQQQSRGG